MGTKNGAWDGKGKPSSLEAGLKWLAAQGVSQFTSNGIREQRQRQGIVPDAGCGVRSRGCPTAKPHERKAQGSVGRDEFLREYNAHRAGGERRGFVNMAAFTSTDQNGDFKIDSSEKTEWEQAGHRTSEIFPGGGAEGWDEWQRRGVELMSRAPADIRAASERSKC